MCVSELPGKAAKKADSADRGVKSLAFLARRYAACSCLQLESQFLLSISALGSRSKNSQIDQARVSECVAVVSDWWRGKVLVEHKSSTWIFTCNLVEELCS